MEQTKEEKGLSLIDVFHAIKRHIIAILLIVIFCGCTGIVYAKAFNPVSYQLTTNVYATYTGTQSGSSSVSGSESLDYGRLAPKTFVDALNNDNNIWRKIEEKAEKIIKENDEIENIVRSDDFFTNEFTSKTIGKGLTASCDSDLNSFIFSITFVDSDKSLVAPVIDATLDVLTEITDKSSTDSRYDLFKLFTISYLRETTRKDENGNSILNIDDISTTKTSTKKLVIFALGIGVCFAAAYVLIFELADQKITSRKTIEENCDLKIIGLIPDLGETQNKRGKLYGKKK